MVDISKRYDHYARRLSLAMKARKLTNEGLAEMVDAHPVTISKLRTRRIDIDDEWRARFASAMDLPEDVLFGDDELPPPRPFEIYVSPKKAARRVLKGANQNAMLPVYGLAAGAISGHHTMGSEVLEEVPCPPALRHVHGAYVLRTRSDSMSPRYLPGEPLYINPLQRVRPGDHVVIQGQLHENSGVETWVKRFDAEDDRSYFVWQYNPPGRVEFRKKYIVHVHRVVPTEELFVEPNYRK